MVVLRTKVQKLLAMIGLKADPYPLRASEMRLRSDTCPDLQAKVCG
jgi:hypothetical protein